MLVVVLAGVLAFVGLASLRPSAAASLAEKEGALEHLSHVLLALASIAWAVAAARAQDSIKRERATLVGLSLLCVLLLGEELDWGGVYGWNSRGGNLHNAWGGASYLLFALPPLYLVGVVGWRRGHGRGRLPRRTDAIGLGILATVSFVGTLGWPRWEAVLDEVGETVFYVGLVWMALRPVTARKPHGPASDSAHVL